MNSKLECVQVWRGFAALLVVVVHVFLRLDYISESRGRPFFIGKHIDLFFCEMGVDAFFIISGFIMVYISEKSSAKGCWIFVSKRLLRIYPSYWIYSVLMMLTLVICIPSDPRLEFDLDQLVRALMLVPTVNEVAGNIFPRFLDQGWTLMYELVFYLVFAVFLKFQAGFKVLGVGLILVFLHLMALRTGLMSEAMKWLFSDSVMLEFLLGMVIGYVFVRRSSFLGSKTAIVLSLAAVCLFLYFQLVPYFGWGERLVSYAIPLSILFGCTVFWRGVSDVKFPRLFILFGDASYTIYLTHTIFIVILARLNRSGGLLAGLGLDIQFVVWFFAATSIGLLLFWVVERPLNEALRRLFFRSA